MQRQTTIEEIARKLKPLFGEKIDQLYFKYTTSESFEEKNELLQILGGLYQKYLSRLLDREVLLEPPIKEEMEGDYPLAHISYAKKKLFPFELRESDWPRHVCVTGMSGSGKTTFAINILKTFLKKDKPFLVFDWKKSFRPLVDLDSNVRVFTIGNDLVSNFFKTNINIPPKGIAPKEWINTLSDLLVESFSASFGVHKILLETLDEIFEAWGIYKGEKHYPNWQHVKKLLENKARNSKGRETGWYESAMRIASVLTFGSFGAVVNYDGKKSFSIEDLFNKKVIFELNSLGNIEKKFFAEYILTYIYKLKKANERKDTEFDYAILVDEAHNVFLKQKTNFVSESVTDMIYREMREYGVGLICLDQHASKLSDTVTGNSACHVAFQQQLPEDIRAISGLTQLSDNKEVFSRLPVGSAIVKLSERSPTPFLIEAPFIDLREYQISDERLAKRMKYALEGENVQKEDSEFFNVIKNYAPLYPPELGVKRKRELIEKPKEEVIQEIKTIVKEAPKIKTEIKETFVEDLTGLTETQKILYDFVKNRLKDGENLIEIELALEERLEEQVYNLVDVLTVLNRAIQNKIRGKKVVREIQVVESDPIKKEARQFQEVPNGLSSDQNKFLVFLKQHSEHNLNTTSLYKAVGLSARKGNNVKNELLEKGLIKIQEIKYDKGWKKLIRLA